MPALAPHDSANATECSEERIDEQQRDRPRRRARARSTRAGHPASRAARSPPSPKRATPTARSGSSPRTRSRSRARWRCGRRAAAGGAAARPTPSRTRRSRPRPRAGATRPESRYAPMTGAGMPRVSPSRKPATSARGVGASERVPRRMTRPDRVRDREQPVRRGQLDDARLVEAADGVAPPGPIVVHARTQRREPACEHHVIAGLDHPQRGDVVARGARRAACGARRGRRRPGSARSPRTRGRRDPRWPRRAPSSARAGRSRGWSGEWACPSSARPIAAHAEQRARDGGQRAAAARTREPGRRERARRRRSTRRSRPRCRTAPPPRCPAIRRRQRDERPGLHVRPSRDRGVVRAWRRRCRARGRGR